MNTDLRTIHEYLQHYEGKTLHRIAMEAQVNYRTVYFMKNDLDARAFTTKTMDRMMVFIENNPL